ncbi:hypothetical protein FXO38_30332 [Capsicum annuum]|uniref:Uncharacterized protein n=1 Tax=Capsicum annuum TaxID=4072 RepID=A0A2G2XYV2_CAPAN|nr:hypothetical protein FXO38_30332 [Capsicum annuum]PHT62678.1 hypothetical protein T459_33470 [Capsicum annuum]
MSMRLKNPSLVLKGAKLKAVDGALEKKVPPTSSLKGSEPRALQDHNYTLSNQRTPLADTILSHPENNNFNAVRGRGAGKRVELIRLDDREKQNEIRILPKKKQGYGYHDRSPSIKKNLSKSLRVSGAFKHPKYARIENDIAFLIENDDSFRKTNLFKFFFIPHHSSQSFRSVGRG